jgi:hypothetical protein
VTPHSSYRCLFISIASRLIPETSPDTTRPVIVPVSAQ